MASLYKRRARFWIGYSVNGRRVDRSLFTTNPRVARDKKRRIEYELAIGDLHQASKLPLAPTLETFYRTQLSTPSTKPIELRHMFGGSELDNRVDYPLGLSS